MHAVMEEILLKGKAGKAVSERRRACGSYRMSEARGAVAVGCGFIFKDDDDLTTRKSSDRANTHLSPFDVCRRISVRPDLAADPDLGSANPCTGT